MTQSRPVRIAVQLQPQHAEYSVIRDRVKELEQLGVDVLFNWDHFFPLYGEPDGLHFEAWTELASWAEMTSRVEFGTLVNCNSYRNPDLQADMARTLDHISGGRFIFGTGSGWFERDYQEYGYDFGTAGSRLDALAEALPRIESRWQKLNPPPTRKIPVLIGGGGVKKTLKLVAKHADIWHSFATGEELVHKLEVLAGHCETVGRDINEIELSNELREKSVEDADSMREQGITLFTLGITGPDYDLTTTKQWLAWRDSQNG
ncbi:LLM class F420-dependent oxidoreductase [Salinibacterium sp. NSLL150]|uniref:LLM class F420-dependent oxidoreductase n=1 Tax=unclassified Salinibacterium TaxID=2632331 RepID=UPI0018CDCA34|nr:MULTISPECIES: LLM class F420-dependent oxidoreductase [unclassified Salinibacterium]MBH0098659.1 LLM class F420-dependent oxidoreductase [Salinibacterium sp. NSLL35]MBH0101414.1 LLM class F420-dependent oxidoreductase [Salinibacterium sp. NSLL150]MBH0104173.1 LLM class F420-dependent oxidoreductase [Salinibacterium sp. NSLL16]MBH0106934.1 LLM class F420-dependent oxidoreductase [Salinibacterium sp. NSLL17]